MCLVTHNNYSEHIHCHSLVKCSSKPLLVFSLLLINSSHIVLDVLFSVTSISSVPMKTPSKRARLLLPSYTWNTDIQSRAKDNMKVKTKNAIYSKWMIKYYTIKYKKWKRKPMDNVKSLIFALFWNSIAPPTPPTHTPLACHHPPGGSLEPEAECLCQAGSGWSRCTRDCCHSSQGSLETGGRLVSQSQRNRIQLNTDRIKWYMMLEWDMIQTNTTQTCMQKIHGGKQDGKPIAFALLYLNI